jgi:hypothetical protein
MDDLAELAASVIAFAAAENLAVVPAIPGRDCGPEVCLGPEELDLPGFLALADRLGRGVLYLRAVPFDPDSDEHQPADPPAHLTRRKGQTGEVSVAFAANGVVHFWEDYAAWHLEWQDLADGRRSAERGDQAGRLREEERARLAGELADEVLADPQFRAASRGDRQRIARLALPQGTDQWVGWDAVREACDRAQQVTEAAYRQLEDRLDDLAAELLASPAWQQASSPAVRRQAAGRFLIPHADGFSTIRTHESTRKLARRLEAGSARILSATVSRTAQRWFVSFTVQVERDAPVPHARPGSAIGIDLGVTTLLTGVDDAGTTITVPGPRPLRAALRKLRRASQPPAREASQASMSAMGNAVRLLCVQRRGGGGAAVAQELRAALRLVVLADGRGGGAQHVQRAQEAAVRLVLPRHRAVPLPARPAQLVQAAVVAGPRVRVSRDRVALGVRPFGQRRPGRGVGREPRRHLLRRLARGQRRVRLGVREQVRGGRLA